MAASIRHSLRLRCSWQKLKYLASCRCYSIQPPEWLGGANRLLGRKEPDGVEKTLEERMQEWNDSASAPSLKTPINIGVEYRLARSSTRETFRQRIEKRKNKQLEQDARLHKLEVPLDEVKEHWLVEYGPLHSKSLAEHYGVYRDLFYGAFFYPVVHLSVGYDCQEDEELVLPVYMGNSILPAQAATEPHVNYEADENSLWTLLLVNPDGHLVDNDSEYLHWFVGNIPGCDVARGETVSSYLQPFPPKGTGFHRHIFLLLKQASHIDYSDIKMSADCNLEARTFKTGEFFRSHFDHLTPVGLSFFQSEWDHSVREVYHSKLGMTEPEFEFAHPQPYHPPLVKYPHKQPFDRYYDRYRDKKEIAEEVLKMRLRSISPFSEPRPQSRYPLIHREQGYKPSWLKTREETVHRRIEQYKDLS